MSKWIIMFTGGEGRLKGLGFYPVCLYLLLIRMEQFVHPISIIPYRYFVFDPPPQETPANMTSLKTYFNGK